MPNFRVAVDIGGTFTDICVLDEKSGTLNIAKVASTEDPIDAALAGVKKLGIDLHDVTLFAHGTTVATNTIIERRGVKVGLVTTKGFRDVLELGRFRSPHLYDINFRKR